MTGISSPWEDRATSRSLPVRPGSFISAMIRSGEVTPRLLNGGGDIGGDLHPVAQGLERLPGDHIADLAVVFNKQNPLPLVKHRLIIAWMRAKCGVLS